MNKLMIAAVHLYHNKEAKAFDLLIDVFDGKYDPTIIHPEPNKLWFWGLNRWGKEWPEEEYRIREEKRVDK